MKFSDAAARYVNSSHLRDTSRIRYRNVLASLRPLHRRAVCNIRPQHVQAALNAMATAPSQQLALKLVRAVLGQHGNEAARAVRVRGVQKDARSLSRAEAEQLEAALPDTLEGDALRVLLATGLRVGELVALCAEDWDSAAASLRVARSRSGATKSGRTRHVDVPNRAAAILSRRAQGGLLFPVCERQLRRVLVRGCKAAGLAPCRLHDLRHTRVTQLLQAGAPMHYVTQQAGHHSPSFTLERYAHLAAAAAEDRRGWANLA